jgi:hypothetical protein
MESMTPAAASSLPVIVADQPDRLEDAVDVGRLGRHDLDARGLQRLDVLRRLGHRAHQNDVGAERDDLSMFVSLPDSTAGTSATSAG